MLVKDFCKRAPSPIHTESQQNAYRKTCPNNTQLTCYSILRENFDWLTVRESKCPVGISNRSCPLLEMAIAPQVRCMPKIKFGSISGLVNSSFNQKDRVAFEIADRVHGKEKNPKPRVTLLELSNRSRSKYRRRGEIEDSPMIYSGRRALSAAIYRSVRIQSSSSPKEFAFPRISDLR